MGKNSTLELWDYLSKQEYIAFDKQVHKILSDTQDGPKKETIDTILAYASSVKGIKTALKDPVLISLN